jgi:hypothetical protein
VTSYQKEKKEMKLEDYELGGTALRSSDIKGGKVLSNKWKPNLAYAWEME